MIRKSIIKKLVVLFGMVTLLTTGAQAGVVVNGTRVIYPAARQEVDISVQNTGNAPALVQAWIDNGEPEAGQVPFVLTPPLFRVDANKGQSLRLFYTRQQLPTDRESLFWLNILDIPPKPKAHPNAPNQLQLAFRHRLKLFFRPATLTGDPAAAPSQLIWALSTRSGKPVVTISNPTAYHVSLASADLADDQRDVAIRSSMVGPFASADVTLPDEARLLQGHIRVKFSFINDFGGVVTGEASVLAVD